MDTTSPKPAAFRLPIRRVTSPVMTITNFPQGRNTPVRQYIDNYAWVKGNHQMRFGGEFRRIVATSFLYNTRVPARHARHQRLECGQSQHLQPCPASARRN